eukprot:4137373-Prymnesium_polylepis.1
MVRDRGEGRVSARVQTLHRLHLVTRFEADFAQEYVCAKAYALSPNRRNTHLTLAYHPLASPANIR